MTIKRPQHSGSRAAGSGSAARPGEAAERRQVARNTLSSYAARATAGLSAFILTPYLYRELGRGAFGTWSVMATIASAFTLFEMGFSQGIAKFVSEHNANHDDGQVRATLRAGTVAFALLGLAAAGGCVLVGRFGSGLAAADSRGAFSGGMLVLAGAVVLRFPLVAYGGALQGYQRYDLFYPADIVLQGGFIVAAVVLVALGGDVFSLAVAWGVALVVSALLYWIFLRRVAARLWRARDTLTSGSGMRLGWRLAAFSSFTVLAESMNFIAQRLDTVVIAAVRNAVTAAPYAAALKLQSGLQALTTPFATQLLPMMSDLRARGRDEMVVERLALTTRVTLQIVLPVAVGLALFAPDGVRLWLGHDVPTTTFAIVAVLMAVQAVTLTAFPSQTTLVGIGEAKTVGLLAVIEGVANLGISIWLVSEHGAIGAALGSLFTSAVMAPIKFPLVCRALGCRLTGFLRAALLPAALAALPGTFAMIGVRLTLSEGPVRLAVGLCAGLGLALAIGVAQVGPRRMIALAGSLLSGSGRAASGEAEVEMFARS